MNRSSPTATPLRSTPAFSVSQPMAPSFQDSERWSRHGQGFESHVPQPVLGLRDLGQVVLLHNGPRLVEAQLAARALDLVQTTERIVDGLGVDVAVDARDG